MLNIEKYKDKILKGLDDDDLGYTVSTIFYIYSVVHIRGARDYL